MHTTDFLLEYLVRPGPAAQRPGLPSVVAAPRDAENPRHRGDSMLGLVGVDEPIDHVVIDAADGAGGTRKGRGRPAPGPAPDRAVSLAGHFVRLRPRTRPGRIVRAARAGAVLVFHRSQRAESARLPEGARKAFRLPVPPLSRRSRIRRGSVRRHFCSPLRARSPRRIPMDFPPQSTQATPALPREYPNSVHNSCFTNDTIPHQRAKKNHLRVRNSAAAGPEPRWSRIGDCTRGAPAAHPRRTRGVPPVRIGRKACVGPEVQGDRPASGAEG